MQLTNASKAAVIGAVNAVLGVLAAFGVAFSPNTDFKIGTIATIVLAVVTFLTRKKSPKWVDDVAKDVTEVAPVVETVVKQASRKKPATSKTGLTK